MTKPIDDTTPIPNIAQELKAVSESEAQYFARLQGESMARIAMLEGQLTGMHNQLIAEKDNFREISDKLYQATGKAMDEIFGGKS